MFKTYSSSSSLVITSRWFATSRLVAPVSVRLVYYNNMGNSIVRTFHAQYEFKEHEFCFWNQKHLAPAPWMGHKTSSPYYYERMDIFLLGPQWQSGMHSYICRRYMNLRLSSMYHRKYILVAVYQWLSTKLISPEHWQWKYCCLVLNHWYVIALLKWINLWHGMY